MTTSNKVQNLPVGFIAVSLGLNYLLMLYFGARIRRYKAWLYPIMLTINPFFTWIYMVYGIFTADQRTWGGPRADAGTADADTTPQQAIEYAKATEDELNVVSENFKPAIEARHPSRRKVTALQSSAALEGVFAPSEDWEGVGTDSLWTRSSRCRSSRTMIVSDVRDPSHLSRLAPLITRSPGRAHRIALDRVLEEIEDNRQSVALSQRLTDGCDEIDCDCERMGKLRDATPYYRFSDAFRDTPSQWTGFTKDPAACVILGGTGYQGINFWCWWQAGFECGDV